MFAGASLDENSGAFCELKANFFRLILTKAEVLGLKWEDCDFEKREITINKTIHYSKASSPVEGSKFFYTTAKTISSNRVIPMTDEVYEICKIRR